MPLSAFFKILKENIALLNLLMIFITAVAVSATLMITLNLHNLMTMMSSSTSEAIKVQETKLERDQDDEREPTIANLIASTPRLSNILSYRLKQEPLIEKHSSFIRELAREIVDDNTLAVAFEQLRNVGSNRSELLSIDSETFLFRNRWVMTIPPGSYFYQRPFSKVLMINEAFSIQPCSEGYEPYVAHISTNPELEINIIRDTNFDIYGHRAIAKNAQGTNVIDNLADRIIIDAGCSPRSLETGSEQLDTDVTESEPTNS
jgi:hypothetical protein